MFDTINMLDGVARAYVYFLLIGGAVSVVMACLPNAFKPWGRIGAFVAGGGMIGYAIYMLQPSTTEYNIWYYVFFLPLIIVIGGIINMRNAARHRQAALNPMSQVASPMPQASSAQAVGAAPIPGSPFGQAAPNAPYGQAPAPYGAQAANSAAPASPYGPTPYGTTPPPSPYAAAPAGAYATPNPTSTASGTFTQSAGATSCKKCGAPLPYEGATCPNH